MWQRMVVIGDSVAEGVREPVDGFEDVSWADRVAGEVAADQLNLGKRDLLTAEIRERQLARALDYAPDLAFVLAGANDMFKRDFAKEDVADELEVMIAALHAQGALVLTMGLFDLTAAGLVPEPYAERLHTRIRELSELTAKITARHHGIHLDFTTHPSGADPAFWSSDRIHLNARGHALVADITLAALRDHASRGASS